jgi:hypothetical protein
VKNKRRKAMHDFNNAEAQREFSAIPDGTICVLHMTVRSGNAGEGGWLRRSKDGASEGLDAEFTVVAGPYAKRKLWTLFTLSGPTDGHLTAGRISASKLRAILESARGIKPSDQSETAVKARSVGSFGEFDGLRFMARIGVEPAQGNYKAKNEIDHVITPDDKRWHPVEQVPAQPKSPGNAAKPTAASAPVAQIGRPAWAS